MKTETRSRFLELRELTALENMRFTTRRRIEGAYSGQHNSRQLGGSGEFVDYREYSPGEDLRRMDWRVLARTGRAYVKLYQEETNLVCTMFVDASSSMLFGGMEENNGRPTKLEYAQYLTTALSHVISTGRDQVGLAIASAGLQEYMGPGSTARHISRLHEAIETIDPQPESQLAEGLAELMTRVKRRGVLLLVSDFLVDDLEPVFSALRQYRHNKWEIVALHLIDPDEETLPSGVAYRFVGLEDEAAVACSPNEIRAAYQEKFAAHQAMVRSMALASGCDYRRISTGIPYLQTLSTFLVERAG